MHELCSMSNLDETDGNWGNSSIRVGMSWILTILLLSERVMSSRTDIHHHVCHTWWRQGRTTCFVKWETPSHSWGAALLPFACFYLSQWKCKGGTFVCETEEENTKKLRGGKKTRNSCSLSPTCLLLFSVKFCSITSLSSTSKSGLELEICMEQ